MNWCVSGKISQVCNDIGKSYKKHVNFNIYLA